MLKTAPALLAICAALVAAAPAAADSIAYVKDGDIWLATPDGARRQQVTRTGTYSYVSQADDGTLAALVPGEKIQKLSRTGQVLAEFGTYVSDGAPQGGPVSQFGGPFEPEISPDGKLIAYEWQNASYYEHSSCSGASVPPCYVLSSRWGVGITHADRFTGSDEFGLLTGWIGPSWWGNDRLIRSGASVSPNEDAVVTTVGGGADALKRWFWDDNGASGVEEVELSRDGRVAAGISGFGSDHLRIYRVLYDPMIAPAQDLMPFHDNPDVVEPCIESSLPAGGKYENLSFAPDGRHLAYSQPNGIYVVDVPDIAGGCGPVPSSNVLLVEGARHPHWGPADIPPASAYEARADDGGAVVPPNGGGGGDVARPAAPVIASVKASRAKLRAALSRGLSVTLTTTGPGSVAAAAKAGGRKVASGRGVARSAGAVQVRLAFSAAAKRALKRKRSARLAVAVTFTPSAGGAAVSRTVAVTLRR